jgi:hypothetical protein
VSGRAPTRFFRVEVRRRPREHAGYKPGNSPLHPSVAIAERCADRPCRWLKTDSGAARNVLLVDTVPATRRSRRRDTRRAKNAGFAAEFHLGPPVRIVESGAGRLSPAASGQ